MNKTIEYAVSVEICLNGAIWNRVFVHKDHRDISKWSSDLCTARGYKSKKDAMQSVATMAAPPEAYRAFKIHTVEKVSTIVATESVESRNSKQAERIAMLDKSFSDIFDTGKYREEFRKAYLSMYKDISELDFSECIVELSNKRDRIDFNLFYKNGLYISIARPVDATDNVDFFSVSHNKKKLVINAMNHDELMKTLPSAERIADERAEN